ncbi:hypothetical protein A4R26_10440 [Niastella populi]|uniref:Uncharacterized protein n=1 Tax=Niastella populi TaxID=550983 RepID=A0A1V9GBF5_9BACT|nr:hypothetical protein A4R26_10440 [Niastella populi]
MINGFKNKKICFGYPNCGKTGMFTKQNAKMSPLIFLRMAFNSFFYQQKCQSLLKLKISG